VFFFFCCFAFCFLLPLLTIREPLVVGGWSPGVRSVPKKDFFWSGFVWRKFQMGAHHAKQFAIVHRPTAGSRARWLAGLYGQTYTGTFAAPRRRVAACRNYWSRLLVEGLGNGSSGGNARADLYGQTYTGTFPAPEQRVAACRNYWCRLPVAYLGYVISG
jgi:hypothetical protein